MAPFSGAVGEREEQMQDTEALGIARGFQEEVTRQQPRRGGAHEETGSEGPGLQAGLEAGVLAEPSQSKCARGRETRSSGLGSGRGGRANERVLGRTGASQKPRAGGAQPGSQVADRTCVEQAENELGGSLSLFQRDDGSARPCDTRRGLRLQTDPVERGQPCRPGGPAAGQEEHPMFLRSCVSPLGKLQSVPWSVVLSLPALPLLFPLPDSAACDLRPPNQGCSWAGQLGWTALSSLLKRPLRLAGPECKPSSYTSEPCGLGRPLWETGVRTVPASIQGGWWEDMFTAPEQLLAPRRDAERLDAVSMQEVALGTSFKDCGV